MPPDFIPSICGRSSAVECLLPKEKVTGANPAARSLLRLVGAAQRAAHGFCQLQCTNLSFLEYDYYQDDKFGRILAYVWENCTSQLGCNNGQRMVNWLLVKKGIAKVV